MIKTGTVRRQRMVRTDDHYHFSHIVGRAFCKLPVTTYMACYAHCKTTRIYTYTPPIFPSRTLPAVCLFYRDAVPAIAYPLYTHLIYLPGKQRDTRTVVFAFACNLLCLCLVTAPSSYLYLY